MTVTERRKGAVRYDCLRWSMQAAARGEDAMATLARAQLFAEFVLQDAPPPIAEGWTPSFGL